MIPQIFKKIEKGNREEWKAIQEHIILSPEIYKNGPTAVYLTEHKTTKELGVMKVYSSLWILDNEQILMHETEGMKDFYKRGFAPVNLGKYLKTKNNSYFPMGLCNCGSLNSYITKDPLPEPIIKDVAMFLAKTINGLHNDMIIHRDINPSHVLVHMDAKGNISYKLIGAQFYKKLEAKTTASFVGTVAYRAPESSDEKEYTFSYDIWSLGLTLYELANACMPSAKDPNYVAKIRAGCVPEFSEKYKGGDILKNLICWCLLYSPEKRPSAGQLLKHPFLLGMTTIAKEWELDLKKAEPSNNPTQQIQAGDILVADPASIVPRESLDECQLMDLIKTDFAGYMQYVIDTEGKGKYLKVKKKDKLDPLVKEAKAIAVGGFSEVYRCVDQTTKETHILKVVLTNKMEAVKVASLLLGEVEIMLALNDSAFSIGISDYFVYENNLCLVIDYCNGGDLEDYIRNWFRTKKTHPPIEELRQIAWNVGCGLLDMHSRHLIHRDIKPKNILLIKDEDEKLCDAKLCDYGLSRKLNEKSGNKASTVLGTFDYFAPELFKIMDQMNSGEETVDKYDDKVDVWSYGVLLYFCIYGRTPMEPPGSKNLVVKKKIINFPPVTDIPDTFIQLIKRCLDYDSTKRPGFRELLLEPFFCNSVVYPKPNMKPYSIVKEIGKGLGSKVYEGKNGKKVVAIKTIPSKGPGSEKVNQEIATLNNLRGAKNVIRLKDYFTFKDQVHLVFDMFNGGNLEAYIFEQEKKKATMTSNQLIYIAYCIINGLEEIHSRNLIHRDIHPKNVLLKTDATRNTVTEVVIADFGYAKVMFEGDLAKTRISGYASPEMILPQYNGKHDQKHDIWSYGLVLYFIMFALHAMDDKKNNNQYAVFKTGNVNYDQKRKVPQELLDLMKACLKSKPEDRPTAKEILMKPLFKSYCKP